MKQIGQFTNFIGLEPGVYSMGSPGVQQIASGNPITIQSAAAPFTEMLIFGKTTQDGTPSPENPVALDTAGASGQVNVGVGGANLIDTNVNGEGNGITWKSNPDGSITINGTAIASIGIEFNKISALEGEEYYLFGYANQDLSNLDMYLQMYTGTDAIPTLKFNTSKQVNKKTCLETAEYFIRIRIGAGVELNNVTVYPMISKAQLTENSVFQPYVTPQTLIIPTPNGLPGVPTTGEEYTYIDSEGQKRIADSVEYFADGTGRYVQRTAIGQITKSNGGISNIRQQNPDYFGVENGEFKNELIASSADLICNKSLFVGLSKNIYGDQMTYVSTNGIIVFGLAKSLVPEETPEAVNAYLAENPFTILYPLAEPIITPLSDVQVAEFKALTTYEPTTVIQNDAGCWMQVGYYSGPAIQRLIIDAQKINGV